LFVAAMTKNQGLRSALIVNVYNGTIADGAATDPAFAVYIDSVNGSPLQGVSR
jgi:hypothetical protein